MVEARRFWLRALSAAIIGTALLVTAVAFIPLPHVGIQTSTGCFDFVEGADQQSYCEDYVFVGAGFWVALIIGIIAIVFCCFRFARTSRPQHAESALPTT